MLRRHDVARSPRAPTTPRSPGRRRRGAVRDAELLVEIRRVYADRKLGRGLYGARKMWRQLRPGEHSTGGPLHGRAADAPAGLRGVRRGRPFVTTRPDPAAARPPDLVKRALPAPTARTRLWVVDFTYVPTWSGMAFTAFVTDVFSRRIVGWRTAPSMPTELPLDALEMALWIRAPGRRVRRRGSYTTRTPEPIHRDPLRRTARRRRRARLDRHASATATTMPSPRSVIGLYKTECVRHDGPFRGVDDLELATADWVRWFNHCRLHGAIGYVPPVEFEAAYYAVRHGGLRWLWFLRRPSCAGARCGQDHSSSPAKNAGCGRSILTTPARPAKDWQRWRNRSRMSNLGDHRISGKTESPSNSGCFTTRKASHRKDQTNQPVRSFRALLDHLATLTRNNIQYGADGPTIPTLATPTPTQRRVFELLDTVIPLTLK